MALEGFLEEVAERAGVVSAEVRSAVELSPQQQERLRECLEQYTGRKVLLETQVDAGVRGGVVARVGDTVFDGSVNTHLERLRQRLAERGAGFLPSLDLTIALAYADRGREARLSAHSAAGKAILQQLENAT